MPHAFVEGSAAVQVGAMRRGHARGMAEDVRRSAFGMRSSIANRGVPIVTAELERRLGITTPGSYHGIFVTCGTP